MDESLQNIKKAATTSYKDKKIKSTTVYEYTVRAYYSKTKTAGNMIKRE